MPDSNRSARRGSCFAKLIIPMAVLIVFGVGFSFYASNPLRRSDDGIRRWIEKRTPIGSRISDVEAVAARSGWFSHRGGAGCYDGRWLFAGPYIRGELGEYQGLPFRTSVTAFWEFDASNRLTGIRIWRTRDGL